MSVTRSARKNRLSSKSTRHQAIAAISAAASLVAWGAVSKADTYGFNDSSTALNAVSPTPWTDETTSSVGTAAPGANDTAQFDSLAGLTGPATLTLGQNTTWGGLTVLNPGAAITIGNTTGDNTNTLTLGSVNLAGGINMSAATSNLTIVDPVSINAISQSFLVDSGQSLTLNGSVSLSTAASTATLTFGGAGTQNVNGVINDTAFTGGAIAQTGGTLVLTAANNYTGSTQLESGVMELNFNAVGAAASNILPSAAQLRLEGGTLLINGNASSISSQTFSSAATGGPTVVSPGLSTVQVVDNSSGADLPTVALGTITANQISTNLGGQMEFIGPATSTDGLNVTPVPATANISVGSTPTVAASGNILVDTNLFDAFAVVGQPGHPNQVIDWAAVSGGVVTGGSAIPGFYTEAPATAGESAGANVDVSATGEFRISSSRAYTTLRFNTPTGGFFNSDGNTIDQVLIKTGNALTTGGILVTPNVGANNIAFVCEVAGGYLSAGAAALQSGSSTTNIDDLNIFQYNTMGALIINTGIRDSGHTGGYAQAGPGTVELNGSAAATQFIQPTVLNGGLTILGNFAQGAALGNSSTVNLNGGNLNVDYTGTMDNGSARPITVSPNGGGISATSGNTLTVDGVISGGGLLGIGYGAIATNEANNTTGTITQNLPSSPNTAGNGIVVLSGANTYTGGTSVNNGTLEINTGTAGTGPITVNGAGTLAGTATLTNTVTVKSGGQFTPGDPIALGPTVGTIGLGSLNLNAGSISNFGFASVSSYSTVNVNGNLDIASNAVFNFDQAGSTNPFIFTGTYDLFTVSGTVTLGTPVFGSNAAGYTLSTAPDGADTLVVLKLMGVTPETWNTSAGGSWAAAGSWFPSGAPNSVGATAEFLPDVGNTANIANGGVVTLDGNETVGTLIFQNSNSFTISAGTLVPGSVLHIQAVGTGSGTITDSLGSHTITAPVSLDSSVTNVTVSTAGTSFTFGGAVEGIGALSINPTGAGTVILSANNTYGGATTIGGGTLQVGTGTTGSLGTSVTPVVNKGALIMDVNTNQTISVGSTPANGTGSITQNGTGVLALSGVNNAGAIAINHSEIQLATGASLTATGDLTMAASTLLDLNGNSATIGGLSGAGTIDNVGVAAATPTLSFGGDSNSNTFSGIIQNSMGTVSVAKAGNGTETFSAINTYTGGTTINGGAILVTSSSGVNSGVGSGTITVGATNGLQLGNGVTLSNPISITVASSEFEDVPTGSATLSGAIVASGSNQYRVGTISPTATLNLTGASTGGVGSIFIITRGNVVVDGAGASIVSSNTTSAVLIGRQSNTSTLNMTVENGAQFTSPDGMDLGSGTAGSDDESIVLAVQGASSVNAGGIFNLNDDSDPSQAAPAGFPTAVNLTLSGASSLTTSAFQATSIAATSTTVLIGGASSIIASANDPAGSAFLPEFSNVNNATAGVSIQIGTGGAIINNGGFNITLGEPLSDGGGTGDSVTYSGTGTTVLANSNSYSGNTTISGGTVVVANGGGSAFSSGTVAVNGGTLASPSAARIALLNTLTAATLDNVGSGPVLTISNQVNVGATGTIAPGEVGTFGTMAFSGLTTVSGSTINFDLGAGSSTAPTSATGDLLLLNGTFSIGSGTALTFGGTPTVGDYYRLIGGSSITSPTIAAAIASEFTLPAGFSLNTSIDPDFIDVFVSSIGPATLTWNDAGGNTPADGRTWDINTDKNWNSGSAGNVVYTEPGGANNPNVIFNDSNNSASNTNAYNVTLSTLVKPSSVTVNNTTGNYTISGTGTIGGTGSLTKSGTGTLTLSTPNTYSGGTIVTAGRLLIGQAGTNAVFTGPTLTTANTLTALPTGALTISGNGIVQLADGVTNQTFVTPSGASAHPTSNINLTSLSLTGDGTLDIGNNRIIIDYTTGNDPIASIKQWIANGFTDGETTGALPAIISSDVGPNDLASGFSYGIGYADGADGAIAGLPSGEIEIMYTLLGDANLDGTVNSEDFTPFSNNLNDSGRSWDQGDFNYDGTVNSEDFTPFSHDLNQSASLAASETGTLLSPLIGAGGISLTNVPEPASTGLLTIGALSVLARRRRKANA